MTEASAPVELGLKEFAVHINRSPAHVTALKQAGRLVLADDAGHRVRVAESIQRIADTANPAKAGVTARHAAAHGQGGTQPPASGAAGDGDASGATLVDPTDPLATRRARAAAEREEALARKALRDEQLELGQLVPTDQIAEVLADATTTLRTTLENLPATLAPLLAAEPDEDRVRVLLADALEHALDDLSRHFAAIGKAVVA